MQTSFDFVFSDKMSLSDIYDKYYSDRISEDDFYTVMLADPTYTQGSDRIGKFGKWLLDCFSRDPGDFRDRIFEWKNYLEILVGLGAGNRLPKGFQINKVKTLDELAELVESIDPNGVILKATRLRNYYRQVEPEEFETGIQRPFYSWPSILDYYEGRKFEGLPPLTKDTSARDARRNLMEFLQHETPNSQYVSLLDSGSYMLVWIESKLAAEVFGEGSDWCTTWSNWDHYNKYSKGLLVVYSETSSIEGFQNDDEKIQFFTNYNGEETEIERYGRIKITLETLRESISSEAWAALDRAILEYAKVSLEDVQGDDIRDYEEEEEEDAEITDFAVDSPDGVRIRFTWKTTQYGETDRESIHVTGTGETPNSYRGFFEKYPLNFWEHIDVNPFAYYHLVDSQPVPRSAIAAYRQAITTNLEEDRGNQDILWIDPFDRDDPDIDSIITMFRQFGFIKPFYDNVGNNHYLFVTKKHRFNVGILNAVLNQDAAYAMSWDEVTDKIIGDYVGVEPALLGDEKALLTSKALRVEVLPLRKDARSKVGHPSHSSSHGDQFDYVIRLTMGTRYQWDIGQLTLSVARAPTTNTNQPQLFSSKAGLSLLFISDINTSEYFPILRSDFGGDFNAEFTPAINAVARFLGYVSSDFDGVFFPDSNAAVLLSTILRREHYLDGPYALPDAFRSVYEASTFFKVEEP